MNHLRTLWERLACVEVHSVQGVSPEVAELTRWAISSAGHELADVAKPARIFGDRVEFQVFERDADGHRIDLGDGRSSKRSVVAPLDWSQE